VEYIINNKKGNAEIVFLVFVVTILIIFLFIIYILYIQITTYIIPIKQDLFYIVQNSYFALNQIKLEYQDYYINEGELKGKIYSILKTNYPKARINYVKYDYNVNKVRIEVIVPIKPVILQDYIGDINFKIRDNIKLKTMEVK